MSIDELIKNSHPGINDIRLRDLLTVREDINDDPFIRSMFPPIGMGSITLVDQIVLLALAQIITPKKIIEVGTFLGFTTSLLSMNTSANIVSIDLPQSSDLKELKYNEELIEIDGNHNDDFLRKQQAIEGEMYLEFLTKEERKRVELIKADSTTIDFKGEFGRADFVFIDGGHEKSIVEKDTINARSLVNEGVIIWHDFGSRIHNDVTEFLKQQSGHHIFHVIGSLCAFEFVKK
ncbi:class I SAM-dependent methyltransferase [Alphaproteobacteria bacterium]|nr:class I SAM-dependent methyltransferase [Alphaproteobacteria bacterium]